MEKKQKKIYNNNNNNFVSKLNSSDKKATDKIRLHALICLHEKINDIRRLVTEIIKLNITFAISYE